MNFINPCDNASVNEERKSITAWKGRPKIKIYTGVGDFGKTGLFSGERVSKSYDRVEAYGDVDELNSVLGMLTALLGDEDADISGEIRQIQSDLFHIGAWLATMPGSSELTALEKITERHIETLERAIDRMDASLPVLKGFVFPGGHVLGAWAHVARTVCRRAERHVVRLCTDPCEIKAGDRLAIVVTFLNRLSDYLFVLARHLNRTRDVADVLWKK